MTTVSGSTTPSLDLSVASVLSHLVAVVLCLPQWIGTTARVAEKGRSDPGTCSTGRCPPPRVSASGKGNQRVRCDHVNLSGHHHAVTRENTARNLR